MSKADISWLTARPIAHRGLHDGNRQCWENTLSSFRRAIKGDYAIECDITLTRDRIPIVFHDHELFRLTGREGRVCEMTAEEICKLEIGGTTERVPRLSEALFVITGRVPIVIELKGNLGHDDGLIAAVARDLDGYGGHAAIMSFDHHLVRQFAGEAPNIPAGLTAEGDDDAAFDAHMSMLAHDVSFISYDVASIPNRFVTYACGHLGLPLITWTVGNQKAAELTWREGGQITFEGFTPEIP